MMTSPQALATNVLAQTQAPADPQTHALLQRICVRPPYFALRDLRSPEPGTALAWIAPEQPLGAEAGPVAAAEVGRHLAILGSVALASLSPDGQQRYYLARAAHFERVCGVLPARSQAFVAEATTGSRWDGARNAVARSVLRTPSGVTTHLLHVEYTVLDARVFERLFRARRQPTPPSDRNPHAEPLLLAMQALDERHARATLRFGAEQCSGHFDGCPAVPIARLMQGLISLAGRLYQHRQGDASAPYAVLRADVRAQKLAFAGEPLLLCAEHARDRGEETAVRCRATLADGSTVGELDLWLAAAP